MNALILVDIQNDFLPGGTLAVPHGDQVIPIANRLLPSFPLAVATQDWHPPHHGSFAANHPGHQVGERISLEGQEQILWPVHCVEFTPGAEFAADLNCDRIQRVFRKGMNPRIDSYSGFFDNGRKQDTGLADFLHAAKVTDVYVLGLATDYCVLYTALDAAQLGFHTFCVEDGCRGVELRAGDVDRALEQMRSAGIQITTSERIVQEDRRRL